MTGWEQLWVVAIVIQVVIFQRLMIQFQRAVTEFQRITNERLKKLEHDDQ